MDCKKLRDCNARGLLPIALAAPRVSSTHSENILQGGLLQRRQIKLRAKLNLNFQTVRFFKCRHGEGLARPSQTGRPENGLYRPQYSPEAVARARLRL